jgi:hypothetical protein
VLVLLIGGVYEIGRSDDFGWLDVHAKFHKIISGMLKFLGVGTPIRTPSQVGDLKSLFTVSFQFKESRLRIKKMMLPVLASCCMRIALFLQLLI